ncbi:MAG: hypothetical protein HYZ20_20555 [Burkholderiales bacterium]|nr:hypothetical protein [Burkholderiales bacterium]
MVRLTSGNGLVVEIKGQVGGALIEKAAAARWYWAVTNDGRFGRLGHRLCFGE